MQISDISVEALLKVMIEAAEKAGEEILKIYDSEDFGIKVKSDESPLTLADENANQVILQKLTQAFPNIPAITEETKTQDYSERQSFEYYWMVDPLDGTKEFIKRNGEFTVNIALGKGQKVVAGVVYVPVTKDMYFAAEGYGAFKGYLQNNVPLQAKPYRQDDANLIVVVSRSHLNEATQSFLDSLDSPQTLATGSSLKFMKIAEGEAHIYPRLGPTMEWDTAAAQIILEESGGSVFTWEGQSPLRYNKENLLNPYFIAKAAQRHA